MKTLAEYHDEHVEHQRALNFSRYTIRQSRCCVGVFLRWAQEKQGVATPERLRPRHLQAWQKALARRTTTKGQPLKARSVNKHVETLNGFLRYLGEAGATTRALAAVLQYVKEPVFLPGSVLSHEQMERLLATVPTDTADGYRLRAMLEVLYSSGMRVAELLGLNLGDVDFGGGTAKVLGKGRKERIVPVGRTALNYLQGYVRAVRSAVAGDGQEQAVFLDGAGRRFPYYTFRRLLHACAARAGLDRTVTPHTFRRSCTTELLRGGANMYHVKELLGHESLETLKHYAKLTITDLKATHEKCHPREKEGCGQS
jgi:site-specific recombinase XerD